MLSSSYRKLLRGKINKKVDITIATDNDLEISKNFWGYSKKYLHLVKSCYRPLTN